MPHRSYDQYCAIARALDLVGERWALLIVRELLAGPRRYTDLHADLPGVSTDVLASRLKDLEREGLAVRRRLSRSGATYVYELTPRGRGLLPVLSALADWGTPALAERRPTDAVRAHWLAVPLLARLTPLAGAHTGTVDVQLDEGAGRAHPRRRHLPGGDPGRAVAGAGDQGGQHRAPGQRPADRRPARALSPPGRPALRLRPGLGARDRPQRRGPGRGADGPRARPGPPAARRNRALRRAVRYLVRFF